MLRLHKLSELLFAVAIIGLIVFSPSRATAGWAVGLATVLRNCQNDFLDEASRLQACSDVIHTNPSSHISAALYAIRAGVYLKENDLDHALGDYNEAIKRNPDSYEALINRAIVLDRKQDYAAAAADYDLAGKIKPDDSQAHIGSCFDHSVTGENLEVGIASCDEGLKLNPTYPGTHARRGLILLRLGRCPEAINDFDIALAEDSGSWMALSGRGICKARGGDSPGARSDIAAAASVNPHASKDFAAMGMTP